LETVNEFKSGRTSSEGFLAAWR